MAGSKDATWQIAPSLTRAITWPRLCAAVGLAAAMAAAAHVRIPLPFTEVPLTLQTLFVFLGGILLGPRLGAVGMALYLSAGVAGLPVTTGPFLGATTGYLVGFLLSTVAVGCIARPDSPVWRLGLGMGVAAVIYLGLGALWLGLTRPLSFPLALAWGVTPFIPGDLLKMAAAMGVIKVGGSHFKSLRW